MRLNMIGRLPELSNQPVEDPAVIARGGDEKIGKADIGGMVGFIRHGAHAQEWHIVDLAGMCDGGGFHIHGEGLVGVPELTGFLDTAWFFETNGNRFEAKADYGGEQPPTIIRVQSAKRWIRLGRRVPAPVQAETQLPKSTEVAVLNR